VLYDADLPGGTLRFAEFFRFGGGQIASISSFTTRGGIPRSAGAEPGPTCQPLACE